MISRREAMGAGLFATLTTPPSAETVQSRDDAEAIRALKDIKGELDTISGTLQQGLVGPGVAPGPIGLIRDRYTIHLRANGRFPDFMEIGSAVFYAVYDWHVRYNQQIQITRIAENRFAIQFMFTQLIVRWEQDPGFLGVPFDR
jgi:hypothetical protein